MSRLRRQCAKCPWKKSTDATQILNGYCVKQHESLKDTIAEPESTGGFGGPVRMMACHETPIGDEKPCVGWLVHQLGVGQNLSLRLAVAVGRIDGNIETVGPQHDVQEPERTVHQVRMDSLCHADAGFCPATKKEGVMSDDWHEAYDMQRPKDPAYKFHGEVPRVGDDLRIVSQTHLITAIVRRVEWFIPVGGTSRGRIFFTAPSSGEVK